MKNRTSFNLLRWPFLGTCACVGCVNWPLFRKKTSRRRSAVEISYTKLRHLPLALCHDVVDISQPITVQDFDLSADKVCRLKLEILSADKIEILLAYFICQTTEFCWQILSADKYR